MRIILSPGEYERYESGAFGTTTNTKFGFGYCPTEAGYRVSEIELNNWPLANDPDIREYVEPERVEFFSRHISLGHFIDDSGNLVILVGED